MSRFIMAADRYCIPLHVMMAAACVFSIYGFAVAFSSNCRMHKLLYPQGYKFLNESIVKQKSDHGYLMII